MMTPIRLRYIGLDIHKEYLVAAAVDDQQTILFAPQRVSYKNLLVWIRETLLPTDAVVLEACSNAWTIHDQLKPHVAQVTIAHAAQVKLIASSLIKTDKRDALALARLLAANLIPPVWVPPPHVRDLRALVHHRRQVVEQRSAVKSRLRALLNRHTIQPPSDYVDAQKYRPWWESLPLTASERLIAQHDLALLDTLATILAQIERELAQLSVSDHWCAQVACLLQLSGVGMLNAMTILSAIGDITRFDSPKKLVGYSGLGARVHSSGESHRGGRITKAGRTELRTALVEAAWVAVQRDGHWKRRFEQVADRRGRGRAIVAIARKMLVVIWHVLTYRQADRYADPEAIANRFMRWGAEFGVARSLGLQRTAFVRRELDRLHIGQAITTLNYSGRVNQVPLSSTVPMAD